MGLHRHPPLRWAYKLLGKKGPGASGGDTRTVAKNVLALATSGLATTVIAAGTDLLIARHLGVEQFGQFATAVAFPWLFVVFADLGMSLNTVRSGSRDPDSLGRHLGNNLVVKTVLSAVLYVVMLAIAPLLGYSEETRGLLLITGAGVMLLNFFPSFSAVFEVHQEMVLPGIFRTLAFAAVAALSVVGIVAGQDVTFFAYANLVGTGVVFLVWWQVTVRRVKPVVKLDEMVPMIRSSFAFALSGVFYQSYFRIGTVALSLLRSQAEVGLFAAAFRLFEIAAKTALTVHTAALPAMYRHSVQNPRRLVTFYRRMQVALGVAAVMAFFLMLALAGPVITLLYGAEFAQAIPALQIIALATFFRYMSIPPADLLIAGDKVSWRVFNQGVAAFASLAMCLGMIPVLGYIGAAISTAISEFMLFALNTLLASRVLARIEASSAGLQTGEPDGTPVAVHVEVGRSPDWAKGKAWE